MLNAKAVNLLKVELPRIPDSRLNKLLEKGQLHFELMQTNSALNQQAQKEKQDVEQARIFFMDLEEQKSNALWKRLFEVEEGFPGDVKQPKNIPGLRPW